MLTARMLLPDRGCRRPVHAAAAAAAVCRVVGCAQRQAPAHALAPLSSPFLAPSTQVVIGLRPDSPSVAEARAVGFTEVLRGRARRRSGAAAVLLNGRDMHASRSSLPTATATLRQPRLWSIRHSSNKKHRLTAPWARCLM